MARWVCINRQRTLCDSTLLSLLPPSRAHVLRGRSTASPQTGPVNSRIPTRPRQLSSFPRIRVFYVDIGRFGCLRFRELLGQRERGFVAVSKKTLIGGIPGLGRDSGLRTTLAGMPGCSSADMRGSSRSSNNTRVASRTGQKQEGFPHHQRYR